MNLVDAMKSIGMSVGVNSNSSQSTYQPQVVVAGSGSQGNSSPQSSPASAPSNSNGGGGQVGSIGIMAKVVDNLGNLLGWASMDNGHGYVNGVPISQALPGVAYISTPTVQQAGGQYGYYVVNNVRPKANNGNPVTGLVSTNQAGITQVTPIGQTAPITGTSSPAPVTTQGAMADMSGTVSNGNSAASYNSNGSRGLFPLPFSTPNVTGSDMSTALNIGVFAVFAIMIIRLINK